MENKLKDRIDLELYERLTISRADLVDLLSNNCSKIRESIEYLDKTYDKIGRVWYYKKLNKILCKNCGKEFKTPSRGVKFCCDICRVNYENKMEQEIIEC